jgi:transcriptional regulator with XRE-family HTH domain
MLPVAEEVTLAARLRQLRTAAGLTQMNLAAKARVNVSIVSQIEQGTTTDPRVSTMRRLARALGVSLDELAGPEAEEG